MKNFSLILHESTLGKQNSEDESLSTIYKELKAIARKVRFKLRAGDTLNTTSLIHEAYLKLLKNDQISVQDKQHFMSLTSRAMRQIILNSIDRKINFDERIKSEIEPFSLNSNDALDSKIEALERAMLKLEKKDIDLIKLIELRFYGGLSIADTAESLGVSPSTVKRQWVFCKAWLQKEIQSK